LAFSTAGGDTASALAGGNPVIIKAHGAHPGTSALVGSAIVKAAQNTGMPDGVFSLLHGSGKVVGQGLINHPGVKAAGFTGSQTAGRILYDIAKQRPEPIPFFAEMGSVNPVILFPSALNSNTVQMLTDSITMGAGQFCTNPGLLLSIKGVNLDQFIIELGESLSQVSPGVMLTEKILKTYNSDAATATSNKEVTVETIVQSENKSNRGAAILVSVSGETFINNPDLAIEIFGPYSMVVKCEDKNQLIEVISNLDGQLTGSVLGTPDESINFSKVIDRLEKKVGRLIFNGVPTGVEVCSSMQHGGPYPAATDVRFSSVGTMSIKRFVRPVAYQSWPDNQLPDELKDDNPLKIWRLVNSELTKN
jgi:NADP-dependent aldehyde dehydrogenase